MATTQQRRTLNRDDGPNLSSWTVRLTFNGIAWTWRADHANGDSLRCQGAYLSKEGAEEDAVARMLSYERGDHYEEVSGFDLQIRVHDREKT